MAMTPTRWSLLRAHPSFARLAAAITVSALGDPLTQIAALVTIYALTSSALAVAGAFVIQAGAALLMSTVLGGLADRLARRSLIIRLGLARAVLLFATPGLIFISPWLILPVLFVLAFTNAIVTPAQQSAVPALVPEGQIGPASSIVTALTWLAGAVGAGIAAIVLLVWPHLHLSVSASSGLFWVDGATFLLATLLILPLGHLGGGVKTSKITAALGTTWRILAARSHLLLAGGAAFALGVALPTFIVLAYRLAGPRNGGLAYAGMEAVSALSLCAGAVMLGRFRIIGSHRTAGWGLALGGFFSLPITLLNLLPLPGWTPLLVGFGLLFLAGLGNPLYYVANITALLESADDKTRGSVMATRFGMTQTMSLLGVAVGGVLNTMIGPFDTFGLVGVGLLVLALYASTLVRKVDTAWKPL